jgi:hypothetical protein
MCLYNIECIDVVSRGLDYALLRCLACSNKLTNVESPSMTKSIHQNICESCSYSCASQKTHQYCRCCKRKLGFFVNGVNEAA